MFDLNVLLIAFLLTFLAGLSTTIGGLVSLFIRRPSIRFLSFIMGFSAGVMIFISFVELLQEAIEVYGILLGAIFFLIGMGIMFGIDMVLSHKYHIDENFFKQECDASFKKRMEKTSIFIFLGIFIHNLPEGIATLVGTVNNVEIGIVLAVAIALHNIPEGIAVAVPMCVADESAKKKALSWSFFSGMSEPLGALIFGLFFLPLINEFFLSALLAAVGGIMVYVSIDELLPVSHCFGNESASIIGIVFGMFVMALSLSLL
ncbi:MAG: zinc transporter ZupT [Promethearchaeia archaeon]